METKWRKLWHSVHWVWIRKATHVLKIINIQIWQTLFMTKLVKDTKQTQTRMRKMTRNYSTWFHYHFSVISCNVFVWFGQKWEEYRNWCLLYTNGHYSMIIKVFSRLPVVSSRWENQIGVERINLFLMMPVLITKFWFRFLELRH